MIAPYAAVALLSCAGLSDSEREQWMERVHEAGVEIVVGTAGEKGSYVLNKDEYLYAPAMRAENIIDTMGAGDGYFAAFLYHLMSSSAGRQLVEEDSSRMRDRIHDAMVKAADFAAHVCELEGAFGFGTEITGRTSL